MRGGGRAARHTGGGICRDDNKGCGAARTWDVEERRGLARPDVTTQCVPTDAFQAGQGRTWDGKERRSCELRCLDMGPLRGVQAGQKRTWDGKERRNW